MDSNGPRMKYTSTLRVTPTLILMCARGFVRRCVDSKCELTHRERFLDEDQKFVLSQSLRITVITASQLCSKHRTMGKS